MKPHDTPGHSPGRGRGGCVLLLAESWGGGRALCMNGSATAPAAKVPNTNAAAARSQASSPLG
eukprot:CAMPEP_0114566544 /NCGR_PEP_ID=MMETSP0114-20121206/14952_1 /TAXON_ID=31324 /ORGANISM="Goniomonas sp, Strain m" /LENGTH=62 /DNA_ID=CAMNT_0001752969 /DNA_START=39 /DNA_END=227 /DNA_ORIENTATION=+